MSPRSVLPSLWDKNGPESFKSLQREIDRVFEDFTGMMPWSGRARGEDGSWMLSPSIDVSETDKAVEVTAELPGVEEKDLDVSVTEDVLTIKGEKKAEKETQEKDYRVVERSYGAFHRSVTLPCEVEADKVEATFDKGVLTLKLPKSPQAKAKAHKIKVKAAH